MTKLPSQHFRCTVFDCFNICFCRMPVIVVLQLQLAWPQLSCVYCSGKVPGWFFRHEMSVFFSLPLSPLLPEHLPLPRAPPGEPGSALGPPQGPGTLPGLPPECQLLCPPRRGRPPLSHDRGHPLPRDHPAAAPHGGRQRLHPTLHPPLPGQPGRIQRE